LRQFQDMGHRVIFLIGDFTAMIGDPSGKSATRPMLSREQVLENAETYRRQVFRILREDQTELRFNSEWNLPMTSVDVLQLASEYTVARMIERDDFQKRYSAGAPISLQEFLYPLFQGYDSVVLESDVELGGTDQKFNLLVGRELQRGRGQRPQSIMTLPLLVGTDGKEKMSKSLGNSIGIEEPAAEIFGKVMSIPDELMENWYELVSDLDADELEEVRRDLREGSSNPVSLKRRLARNLCDQFHGEGAGADAEAAFDRIFVRKDDPEEVELFELPARDEDYWLVAVLSDLAVASTCADLLRDSVLKSATRTARSSDLDHEAFSEVLTQSDRMDEVLSLCAKVAPSPYTVLFTGETGTGKGLLASIIHRLSPRKDEAFVSVNCAAIPETLLEGELFGHVRGAFTGADRDKVGLLVSADHGTLFLDEVGKMSLPMQAKLLHFLDSREVRPVGSAQSRVVDVRVLCASKSNLEAKVEAGDFLEDLYYRLLEFPIEIPPLRDRGEDIVLLAQEFVTRACADLQRPVPTLTRAFVSGLRRYAWPGNVRELEKAMRRAVVLAAGESRLGPVHLPAVRSAGMEQRGEDADHAAIRPLKEQVSDLERAVLQRTLDELGWNRSEAARQLKISYPTLLQKIRIYDLKQGT